MKIEFDFTLDELNTIKKICEERIEHNLEFNGFVLGDDYTDDVDDYTSSMDTVREYSEEVFNCMSILKKLKY